MASSSIPRDVLEFLEDYPHNGGGDPNCSANLMFYSNKLRCRPDGLFIDEMHNGNMIMKHWSIGTGSFNGFSRFRNLV